MPRDHDAAMSTRDEIYIARRRAIPLPINPFLNPYGTAISNPKPYNQTHPDVTNST
jgi:hypothetical protein